MMQVSDLMPRSPSWHAPEQLADKAIAQHPLRSVHETRGPHTTDQKKFHISFHRSMIVLIDGLVTGRVSGRVDRSLTFRHDSVECVSHLDNRRLQSGK